MLRKVLLLSIVSISISCISCSQKNNEFQVNWVNYDGSIVLTERYNYGDTPKYSGDIPKRPSDTYFSYTFNEWVLKSSGNDLLIYEADYKKDKRQYTVNWNNYDGTLIKTEQYSAGDSLNNYLPESYKTPDSDTLNYYFCGWFPSAEGFGPVLSDLTFTASLRSSAKTFKVNWIVDENHSYVYEYEAGTIPKFDVYILHQKGRAFSGWSPEIVPIYEDTTYVAKYVNDYSYETCLVTWYGENGILKAEYVKRGEIPVYTGNIPTKNEDYRYRYKFSGWTPNVAPVHSDVDYHITFEKEEKPCMYNTYFYSDDELIGTFTDYSFSAPSAPQKPSYSFNGYYDKDGNRFSLESRWGLKPFEDAYYFASYYEKTPPDMILVTWENWDGTILDQKYVEKGSYVTYTGPAPSKTGFDDGFLYVFSGWDKSLTNITQDTSFVAQFTKTDVQFNVNGSAIIGFKNEDMVSRFKTIIIPSSYKGKEITSINGFRDNEYIEEVVLPETIKTIEKNAFENCSSLKNINLSSVTKINESAFRGCKSLMSVDLSSVNDFGEGRSYGGPFEGCSSIKEITISDGKKYKWISPYVDPYPDLTDNHHIMIFEDVHISLLFNSCVLYVKTNETWGLPDDIDNYYVTSKSIFSETEFIDPGHGTDGKAAYYISGVVPKSLKKVTIVSSNNVIKENILSYMSSVKFIHIPINTTKIGNYAFYECTSLENILIPNSVTLIGFCTFCHCESLSRVYYEGTQYQWENNINIHSTNDSLKNASIFYYSEAEPTELGNYWHYVDGEPTPW